MMPLKMSQTFSGFPKALRIILLQKGNKFPNVRISYEAEIQLNRAFTAILMHHSLENEVVSGHTGPGK